MTQEQKDNKEYEYYKTTWGILIKYDYQEAFKKSYNDLSDEDRKEQTKQLKELPNFDAEMFKQISWIDIEKENTVKEYTMAELQEKLGENFKLIK